MRNPERIDRICEKFRQLWQRSPDMRFHQLITAFMFEDNRFTEDYFYVEDEETEYKIMTYKDSTENKINKLKTFIEMFQKTLETLDEKKEDGTFDDCDSWHKAAVNVQLEAWYKELASLQSVDFKYE